MPRKKAVPHVPKRKKRKYTPISVKESVAKIRNKFNGSNIKPIQKITEAHIIKQSWVDKYRPKTLDDIIGNDTIKDLVRVNPQNLPHLLLYGPPGTGKTSITHAIINYLYGPIMGEYNILELNASNDNGINVVRDKIIKFSKLSAGDKDKRYPSPSYKLIILDEVDSMTPDAQKALKKAMEKTCDVTRYILICNYEDKIVEAIKSRCVPFRFSPIPKKSIIKQMKMIANSEDINIEDDIIYDRIHEICCGDARRSINTLQNLKYSNSDVITLEDLHVLTSYVGDDELKFYWDSLCSMEDIMDIVAIAEELASHSYPMEFIIKYFTQKIVFEGPDILSDDNKRECLEYISKVERMLSDGANLYLQILSMFTIINSQIHDMSINVPHIY